MKFKLGDSFTILRTLGTSYPPRKGMRVVYTGCSGPVCGTVIEPEYLDETLKIICCAIEFDEGGDNKQDGNPHVQRSRTVKKGVDRDAGKLGSTQRNTREVR